MIRVRYAGRLSSEIEESSACDAVSNEAGARAIEGRVQWKVVKEGSNEGEGGRGLWVVYWSCPSWRCY